MDSSTGVRRLLAGVTVLLTFCAPGYAEEPNGTYRLVMRKLADGTILKPPALQGIGTVKNGVYQLTLFWHTPDGKTAALSRISEWTWSEGEVAAKPIVFMFDDGSGKPPVYEWGGDVKLVPVKREGTKISHQHPLDPVYMVWDGDKEIASIEGVFEDHWERVK